MAKVSKKKPAKKPAKKRPVPSGSAELKAFRAAIQNLKVTGSALAKVARSNKALRTNPGVRAAVEKAQSVAAAIAKAIPTGSPTTTIFVG
jgi:hypothetical protein